MPNNLKAIDLTEGGILKKITLVSLPIIGTQLLQMAYNLTDMFWLGRTRDSVTAVAASGLAGMFLWLGMALLIVGRTGAEIGVSQNLGAGDREKALSYAQQSSRIALTLGLAYAFLLIAFAKPLLSLMRIKEENVLEAAGAYLRIMALGETMSYVSATISGSFNGAGASRLSFMANAWGLAINMILDPLLILFLGWGIRGAGIATVIAQSVVFLLSLVLVKRQHKTPLPGFRLLGGFDGKKVRQIFKWALPVSLESAAFTLLAMSVTTMVSSRYGALAVAAQRVGNQFESLSWLVGGGFSSAVSAFMGQNFGAKKWDRIRKGYRVSLSAFLIWEAAVTLVLVFLGRFLFSLFLSQPKEVVDIGAEYLLILSGCQLFTALEGTCGGTFRGMGKTVPPSVTSIASNLIRPFLCYLLSLKLGLTGIWLGISATAALRGLAVFVWYSVYQRKLPHANGQALENP